MRLCLLISAALLCVGSAARANDFRSIHDRYQGLDDGLALQIEAIESFADQTGKHEVELNVREKDRAKECRREDSHELDCDGISQPQWRYIVSLLWERGTTLQTCFFDGTHEDREHVLSLFKEIIAVTNLKLDERVATCGHSDARSATIRIKFMTDRSCYSRYGTEAVRQARRQPEVPTMGLCSMSAPWNADMNGVVRHEILHALGATHEHLRASCIHDVEMVELRKSDLFHSNPQKNAELADLAIKDVFALSKARESGYDQDSIMQYTLDRKFIKPDPKCNWFSRNTNLSKGDWEGLSRMYPK